MPLSINIPKKDDLPDPCNSPGLSPAPPRRQVSVHSPRGKQKLQAGHKPNESLINERKMRYDSIKDLERIPELDYKPTAKFFESTDKNVLHPLIKRADVLCVAGGFFGDEGKGKTVDAIARHPDVKIVARVNSGENAGHTVFGDNGVKYDFHLCPSGLLTPGKINVVGPECVMDPVSFMDREISQLIRDDVEYMDRLFIGNVHIVCPHHKLLDLMGSWKSPNMSTLQGMGPVHGSKAKRRGLRMDHLWNDKALAKKQLEADMMDYWGMMKNLGITEKELQAACESSTKIQKHVLDFVKAEDKLEYTIALYDKVVVNNPKFPKTADVSHMLREAIKKKEKVLLEGPQSYWLSNAAEKFWDSGTSANTCAAGMLAASRINMVGLKSVVFNIHKTPGSSRVGGGANPVGFVPQNFFSEVDAKKTDFEEMKLDWKEVSAQYFGSVKDNGVVEPKTYTNETGTYDLGVAMAAASCIHPSHGEFGVTSGRPRVVGFFDLVAHAEAMAAQGPYCSISALDRGDSYDEYGVCIAYVFQHPDGKSMMSNGRKFESGTLIKAGDQLPTQAILYHCQPIIKKVRGWSDSPIFARSDWWMNRKAPVQLPDPVCEFLDIIEHFSGSRVVSIGNGPKGDEIVYIRRAGSSADKPKSKASSESKAKAKAEANERRIDPDDGKSYTYDELEAFYTGKFKKKEIGVYWESTCKAVKKKTAKTDGKRYQVKK